MNHKNNDTMKINNKGLSVNVYRCELTKYCTHGISSKHDSLILVGSEEVEVSETFESKFMETLVLHKKQIGNNETYLYAVPKDLTTDESFMNGPMFGGNFIYTSDSRFPSNQPIPIHDRFEHQR